jgi:8-oxo-dGTP pyrophosphatase MutT (NUDIX family)
VIETLEEVRARLRGLRARRKWWRLLARRSAVAIPLREGSGGLEILMIERAHREGDRWSGHMAFPGGMLHAEDRNSLAGALRETREEIGVDLDSRGILLARLSDIGTSSHAGQRRPLVINPYVFGVRGEVVPTLNHEVAAVVWVPLAFLADQRNRQLMAWTYQRRTMQLPFYLYAERRIWGLSLRMIDELLAVLGSDSSRIAE